MGAPPAGEHDGRSGRDGRSAIAGRARAAVAARAFAALAENVRDYAIFLLDPDGVITFWGEGARLIKWWTKDQAEGGHLRLLYPAGGSDDGTAEDHLRDAAARGEYTGEGQRVRSDGSTFWAGVTLTALWDEAGALLGFAKVTRDLTARRAADALLQAAAVAAESARADAEAANTAKSAFLASMSHEIRTPVNAIVGYLQLLDLEIDGPVTPAQRAHIGRAAASSRHLLSLIAEVLDFSRIEADRVELRPAAIRVGDVVASALALVLPQARARGLDLADAVSGRAGGLAAWGDEGRVRQILVNLLANAVKFTAPRGGYGREVEPGRNEPGRVTVSAGAASRPSPDAELAGPGPWVYVRVEDTGEGVPADRLAHIFEPFVQADMQLTRTHGGVGLGLAISRRLARLMGGDVTVQSEVGVGSTFVLWLPAAPVESLHLGGLEGARTAPPVPGGVQSEPPTPGTLGGVANAVLGDFERVLHGCVARLRSDPATPSARGATEAQLEDHFASLLGDLGAALRQLDAAGGGPSGVDAARDATAVERLVAERHGAQRARLGWSEQEVRREFRILREELAAAVRRGAPARVPGPTPAARAGGAERVLEVIDEFVTLAEQLSVASLKRAGRTEPATDGPAAPADAARG